MTPGDRESRTAHVDVSRIRRSGMWRTGITLGTLLAATLPTAPGLATSGARLRNVEISSAGSGAVVVIRCEGDFEYDSFSLEAPERFVVDLPGVAKELAQSVIPGNIRPVIQVRMAQFRSLPRPISRVIVDLEEPAVASVERVSGGLALRLEPLITPALEEPGGDPTRPEEVTGPLPAAGPPASLETALSEPTPVEGEESPESPVPAPGPPGGSTLLAAGDTPPAEAGSASSPVAEPPEELPGVPPGPSSDPERAPALDKPEGLTERDDDAAEEPLMILSEQPAEVLLPPDSDSQAEVANSLETAASTEIRPSPEAPSDLPEAAPSGDLSEFAPERKHLAADEASPILPEQPEAEPLPGESDSQGETEDEPTALASAEQNAAPVKPAEIADGDLPSHLPSPATAPERAAPPPDPSRLFERHTRPKETLGDYLRRRRAEQSPMAARSRPTSERSTAGHESTYLLQVVASSNRAEAERWRSTLEAAGYRAFVSILNLPTGVVHRVLLVGFENREEARSAAERIRGTHRIPVAILRVPGTRESPAVD
jgi:septal ring-binding cell division protein DamX